MGPILRFMPCLGNFMAQDVLSDIFWYSRLKERRLAAKLDTWQNFFHISKPFGVSNLSLPSLTRISLKLTHFLRCIHQQNINFAFGIVSEHSKLGWLSCGGGPSIMMCRRQGRNLTGLMKPLFPEHSQRKKTQYVYSLWCIWIGCSHYCRTLMLQTMLFHTYVFDLMEFSKILHQNKPPLNAALQFVLMVSSVL